MELTLRHLAVVVAVAETGGIRRAATAIGVAQPGLTNQIKRIEQDLGGALFERRAAGVVPTELGAQFVAGARDILARFDDLVATSRAHGRQSSSGSLRLGATDSRCLPGITAALVGLLPGREPEVKVGQSTREVVHAIQDNQLDLGVLTEHSHRTSPQLGQLCLYDLGREPLFVGLPRQHRLARRTSVTLADLAGETWAVHTEQSVEERQSLQEACFRTGFTPRLGHRGVDRASAETLIRLGKAVALLSPHVPPGEGVVLLRLGDRGLWRRTRLVWSPSSPIAEVAERFTDVLPAGEDPASKEESPKA